MASASRSVAGRRHPPGATSEHFPSPEVLELLTSWSLPLLLLEVPSERIVSASGSAQQMLSPGGRNVVGQSLEAFTRDRPTGALELLGGGQLDTYTARRVLSGSSGAATTFWVCSIEPDPPHRHALVFMVDGTISVQGDEAPASATADPTRPTQGGSGPPFTLRAEHAPLHLLHSVGGMRAVLRGLSRQIRAAVVVRSPPQTGRVLGVASFSPREVEIVTMLLDGDRVPVIARRLFLSQGTVRNYLASAFTKVEVHSQQELIHLLRASESDSAASSA